MHAKNKTKKYVFLDVFLFLLAFCVKIYQHFFLSYIYRHNPYYFSLKKEQMQKYTEKNN